MVYTMYDIRMFFLDHKLLILCPDIFTLKFKNLKTFHETQAFFKYQGLKIGFLKKVLGF